MKKFKILIFPSYVTEWYKKGDITATDLMDKENWGNIFSGRTVRKVSLLNSYKEGGKDENENVLHLLGLSWIKNYVEPTEVIPPNYRLLESLMSDGRESECDLIAPQLYNFGASFDFVRATNGTHLIFLKDLHTLNSLQNRYALIRKDMGKLIDDMALIADHDAFVCEPIVQSYMML